MRFTRTELSPANKKQYVMAMGKKDIELLHEIALMAHRFMPNTKDLHDDKRRLASISKAFASAMSDVEYDSDEGDKLPIEERQVFKDALVKNPMHEVTRLEIIDHRPCTDCGGKGRVDIPTDSAAGQSIQWDKECPRCFGMGSRGRDVIFYDKNTQVTSSVQDTGKTLKLFVEDRPKPKTQDPISPMGKLNVEAIIELLESHRMR